MLDKVKELLYRLPPGFEQPLYLLPIEFRLGGRTFEQTYQFLVASERWSRNQLEKYQANQLHELLSYAVRNVPAYSDIHLTGLPSRDIKRFPILSKDAVLESFPIFVSRNVTWFRAHLDSTGGTSGRQLRFYVDNSAYAKEWAFIVRLWERVGYKLGDRVVSIRGARTRFKRLDKKIYWREQPVYNALEMSPFHMNPQSLPLYIRKIREWRPSFICGYPSVITILAKYILDNGIREFPHINAVLLMSENIHQHQRTIIAKAFKTRTFSWYGQTEKVILGGECEFSYVYHVFPEYGYMELIGNDGSVIEDSSEEGELVGTGFLSSAMPLIRYRTGDRASLSGEQVCECGRHHTLIQDLKGEWLQEMVIGRTGSLISLTALKIHGRELEKVYNYQYYQDEPGELVLRVKADKNFTPTDERKLIEVFKGRVGEELGISVERVDEVELTPVGKTKLLIQKLDLTIWWKIAGIKQ